MVKICMKKACPSKVWLFCVAVAACFLPDVALAERPDIPRLISVPENQDLAPLRELLLADKNDEAERRARDWLAQVPDPEGADVAKAADLLEIILDAHIANGQVLPGILNAEADHLLALREQAFGPDDLRLIPSL